jgi:hypothetical protein
MANRWRNSLPCGAAASAYWGRKSSPLSARFSSRTVVGTQTQTKGVEANRKYWKNRRNLAANAMACLEADKRNDAYRKCLATHAKGLNSDNPRTKRLTEQFVNAWWKGRQSGSWTDFNLMIRALNRMVMQAEWGPPTIIRWPIGVPLSWVKYEISILAEGVPEEHGTHLLLDDNGMCIGIETDVENFFGSDMEHFDELNQVWYDLDYPHADKELTKDEFRFMSEAMQDYIRRVGVKS